MASTASATAAKESTKEVTTTTTKQRGPNPSTDYKRHFNKTKEKFDTVTAEQTSRRSELSRASLKQLKLQEELDFLIDAIAGEQLQRQQLQDHLKARLSPSTSSLPPRQHAPRASHSERSREPRASHDVSRFDEVEGDVDNKDGPLRPSQPEPIVATTSTSTAKRPRPSSMDPFDEIVGEGGGVGGGGSPQRSVAGSHTSAMSQSKKPRNE